LSAILEFSCENRILIYFANHFCAIYLLPLVDIYLLSHIKSLLLYGGKLPPPPRCGKRGRNTAAGLRVKNFKTCCIIIAVFAHLASVTG